jgi:hypothetical protein
MDAKRALLLSLHAEIRALTNDSLDRLAKDDASVFYPPEDDKPPTTGYSAAERQALQALMTRREGRDALEKLLADACGKTLFCLFTMLDGVADPQYYDGLWLGLRLVEPDLDGSAAATMLHDELLDSYSEYIKMVSP